MTREGVTFIAILLGIGEEEARGFHQFVTRGGDEDSVEAVIDCLDDDEEVLWPAVIVDGAGR